MRYQLLDRGEPVPCTKVDTIEEMIQCIRAFEYEWRRIQDIKGRMHDACPYTIGKVGE